MQNAKRIIVLIGCLASFGCSAPQAVQTAAPPALTPPVAVPVTPDSPGSLWSSSQNNLFSDHKARRIGDILTVAIYEQASASKEAKTQTGRDANASAGISALFGLERNIATINKAIDPSSLIDATYSNDFKGYGSTSRKEDLVATLTTQVEEVLPNGNLRIAGRKTVSVNYEDQIIYLTGIVRNEDITPNNLVDSKYILDAKITYTGKGVITEKQKPGWLMRSIDYVWPF